ncbi:MAG: FtsX-like permease family protein, partial [Firmicutes bacterium]|nr:FtsX-like permease family protein [Bacillota bacterium]
TALLGVVDPDRPATISLYAKDFEARDYVTDFIAEYNRKQTEAGEGQYTIAYTDIIRMMISSVTTIINSISYVLIAFVAISLVVSSIMIGIITYISVLERTKEIGILRSIGASKRDIGRVFNAETLIIGFAAGALGVGVTVLLCVPINMVIESLTGIPNVAGLPARAGAVLIAISMVLTLIAGLIPARIAAKKDPVVALRTE